ncbi:MAG: hypothetical protein ACLP59_27870 [Bryobacteraceae bacterium]
MKKLMTLMLGLSIAMGSVAMFAQNSTDTSKTTSKKSAKKKMKKSTKDTTKTS